MLLTHTSKMPCASFSLPAWECCPTANKVSTAANAVCKFCYAQKGRYRFKNVKNAQRNRKTFILKSLRSDNGDTFVRTMVEEIRKTGVNLFRIHDSGDLFSIPYIKTWIRIAKELPDVKFRCPTREWRCNNADKLNALDEFAKLPNVTLQPSAIHIDEDWPRVGNYSAGTSVVTSHEKAKELKMFVCPATQKDKPHSCHENNCFVCWDKGFKKGIAHIKH